MNDLRWSDLAAQVVAWHNRHPLSRQISVQHVHSLGYVMLPFVEEAAAGQQAQSPAAPRAAPGADTPLPPEAMTGSLRERAMARAQLEAQGAAAAADGQPPQLSAPVKLRPAFDEDFIPPLSVKAVRRWAQKHAVAQTTPRGDVQVRKVKAEPAVDDAQVLPRWVLTAQVEVGRARTRVLVGPGTRPPVLGRRLISPGRTLALFALLGVLVGVASWVRDGTSVPEQAVVPPPVPASVPASFPASVPASAPVSAPASAPASAASAATPASAPLPQNPHVAVAVEAPPPASAPAHTPPPVAAPAASAAPPKPWVTTTPPVDVEPRLGQVELPSLGPRIDERRRRAQQAAASAAERKAAGPAAAPHQAHPPGGPSFAVATRLLRTRSESEQLAIAMRELLAKQPGPPVRVEVLAAGDDWRVVGWPYTDRALADKAQALLASRGMKVQVIDF